MGNGSSSSSSNSADSTRRRQALAEAERRRAEQRLREQQARDREVAAAAATNATTTASTRQQLGSQLQPHARGHHGAGYPGAAAAQVRQEQQQQQAMMQLQHLMRNMTQGGRGFQQAPAVQAVTEGRTISNECAVNTYSFKFDKATSRLEFSVINNVPCEVEVHVAVRLDVYQGIVFSTPNRQRAPPRRVTIDEPNEEGVPLSFVLDEKYDDIPANERTYSMQHPKQFPVVISVLYQHDPSNTPNADAVRARKKKREEEAAAAAAAAGGSSVPNPQETLQAKGAGSNKFDETEARQKIHQRRAEHTCLALDPHLKMVKQLFELEGGTYLVEHLYGGEQEARVISDEAAEAQEAGVAGGATAASGEVCTGGSPTVDADGDDDATCVICLTDERDTAVMPCRHLCLCRGCADELRKHTPKCPVCRGPIQQLLSMKKRK